MKTVYATLFFSFFLNVVFGQVKSEFSQGVIEERISNQLNAYPQEKIHLHIDRGHYVPGEKIWFKAYLTDAVTHEPSTRSRYVYVELINSADSLLSRVMIRPADGMHYGYIYLSEVVPEGYYTIRAYTRYMENQGDDYFYKKNIYISNIPLEEVQASKQSTQSRTNRKKEDYEVYFFPEGGNLLDGVFCKVAFKALNSGGSPEVIAGDIVDEKGEIITSVKTVHAGMGVFAYVPEQGKKYYLSCVNQQGLKKRFELPAINPDAHSITTSWRNQMLFVTPLKSLNAPDVPYYFLMHCRGVVLYFSSWDKTKSSMTISSEQLPSGVIQLVLFDEQMNPLSERLVFNKNNDQGQVTFSTDKKTYQTREKVSSRIIVTDTDGNPLAGNLSVAVTDDKDIAVDSTVTILSSLLLSSELKGYIEFPAYYLQNNATAFAALDYLMMTHGWRRYDIPKAIKGNLEYPEKPFENTQRISGKVRSLMLSNPIANGAVTIIVSDGTFGQTETDDDGLFSFKEFEYPDSISYYIQSLGKKGSGRNELIVNKELFPELKFAPYSDNALTTTIETKIDGEAGNPFILKATQRSMYDEDMRLLHLPEVKVIARRVRKEDEARLQNWYNSSSDVTVSREQIEERRPILVSDMLITMPGVRVGAHGQIFIVPRGIENAPPIVIIDGMVVDDPLDAVPVSSVESIDIFRSGAGTAVFGMRGMSGVISITTKRGGENSYLSAYNYATITPLGYQQPVEFYAPRYETPEEKHLSNPDYRTTLLWKPDVVTTENGEAIFDFYTSDFPTTYSVVIEGLSSDGRIIHQVEKIQVE